MDNVYDTSFCESCPFWGSPDIGFPAVCMFPWFDPDDAGGFIPDCASSEND